MMPMKTVEAYRAPCTAVMPSCDVTWPPSVQNTNLHGSEVGLNKVMKAGEGDLKPAVRHAGSKACVIPIKQTDQVLPSHQGSTGSIKDTWVALGGTEVP